MAVVANPAAMAASENKLARTWDTLHNLHLKQCLPFFGRVSESTCSFAGLG